MPKVVHLTTVHPPFDNRIFHKECRSLADTGYKVVLIAQHSHDETADGIRIRALPQVTSRKERMTRLPPLALNLARAEQAALYHFHDPELLPAMSRLKREGAQVIFDMHENLQKDISNKPWLHPLLRKPVAALTMFAARRWLRGMHVIYAEHSYAADYPWIKNSTTVLNLPRADELLAIKADPAKPPAVGYIGLVHPRKVSPTVLEAFRILKQQGHPVGFECVGPTSVQYLSHLKQLVAQHGLAGIRFHGYRPPSEGMLIMSRCRIGLCVLEPSPNMLESYPTKIFEYMALGLPVVCSDFPLYKSIVENHECGMCVNPHNGEAIAKAIKQLLDEPALANQMGGRGRKAVGDHYRWETEEAKLLTLYKELISKNAASWSR